MIKPRETDLLLVWERGRGVKPARRGLMMLATAFPELEREDLAAWSIGTHNRKLIALFQMLFGQRVMGGAVCPACEETLGFDLSLDQLGFSEAVVTPELREESFGEYTIGFRPPRVAHLHQATTLPNLSEAYAYLVRASLESVALAGRTLEPEELPPEVIAAVGAQIAQLDPGAEILLAMTCHTCAYAWQINFETSAFLWQRIALVAKRLLTETAMLARAYGWSEREILEMTATRRETYLELMGEIAP